MWPADIAALAHELGFDEGPRAPGSPAYTAAIVEASTRYAQARAIHDAITAAIAVAALADLHVS